MRVDEMVELDAKEEALLDRFTDDQVQEFNNHQFTEFCKEHEDELNKILRQLRNKNI